MIKTVLVLANETIAGAALLDAIRERHRRGDARFHVIVPTVRPRHGNVVYDDAVRDLAQVRVDLALAFMREEGIEGIGEIGDPDPMNAARDAIAEHAIDEIIVSTLPVLESRWMKSDLVEALAIETGLPVSHVVVDLDRDGLPFDVTLVVANQTAAGDTLIARLRELAAGRPHRIIVVAPQTSDDAPRVHTRMDALLDSLGESGIVAAGMLGDADPFTAVCNALDYFQISEIIISTLPRDRSRWIADKLPERVAASTKAPVEHIVSTDRETASLS